MSLDLRYRVDPICTFFFSALVLFTTYGTMREATHVLMAGVPLDVDCEDVEKDLRAIPNVRIFICIDIVIYMCICMYIIYICKAMHVLMAGVPLGVDCEDVDKDLRAIPNV